MTDARAERIYVSLAVEASGRAHEEARRGLPVETFSHDADATAAQLHEALLAVLGLGMAQLDHLGDAELAAQLRASVQQFLEDEGYGFAVPAAYEAAWRAGSTDGERTQRVGALYISIAANTDFGTIPAHARIAGDALWKEASGLWRGVAEAMP